MCRLPDAIDFIWRLYRTCETQRSGVVDHASFSEMLRNLLECRHGYDVHFEADGLTRFRNKLRQVGIRHERYNIFHRRFDLGAVIAFPHRKQWLAFTTEPQNSV